MSYYGMGDYYRGDYYMGDPGIFDFVGKAIKGVAGVVAGAGIPIVSGIAGGVSSLLGGTKAPPAPMLPPAPALPFVAAQPGGGGLTVAPVSGVGPVLSYPPGSQVLSPAGIAKAQAALYGGRRTHPNKSTYVTRGGGTSKWPVSLQVHPKGSVQVTGRRLNVGNARALHRAARRIHGAVKMYRKIFSLSHGKPMKGKPFVKRRRKR